MVVGRKQMLSAFPPEDHRWMYPGLTRWKPRHRWACGHILFKERTSMPSRPNPVATSGSAHGMRSACPTASITDQRRNRSSGGSVATLLQPSNDFDASGIGQSGLGHHQIVKVDKPTSR